jgi:8-oxo-dGTP pyrophosphatase MutT (NUDIX family)
MKSIKTKIEHIAKDIKVIYKGEKTPLSPENLLLINEYWGKLQDSGKKYFRGEVFAIKRITENSKQIAVQLTLTDYAHYVYSLHHPGKPVGFACKVAHALVLLETKDDFLVFGKMAGYTAHPGRYQCVGGGIDLSDLAGREIDFEKNIRRELAEEVGIQMDDKTIAGDIQKKYLKTKGSRGSFAIIYKMKLSVDRDDFSDFFKIFQDELRKKNENPEFEELIFVGKSNFDHISEKIKRQSDDYLLPLIEFDLFGSGFNPPAIPR